MAEALLGLGGNVGDVRAALNEAVALFADGKDVTLRSASSHLFMKVKMGTPRRRQTSKSLRVCGSTPLPASMTMTAASTAVRTR